MAQLLAAWIVLVGALTWAWEARAIGEQELVAPPAAQYMAPNRLFSTELPPSWAARTFPKEPDLIELHLREAPTSVWMHIRRIPVPKNAQPRQMLAHALEHRLSKLPSFRLLQRRDVTINGLRGAAVLGTFWYQGNVQYPRAVEEIYLVAGEEAFVFHFECFEPLAEQVAGDVNKIYETFVPRPPGATEVPAVGGGEDPLDKIPF